MENCKIFNKGDAVTTLNYDSPVMTVIDIDGDEIECRWKENGKFCKEKFRSFELTDDVDPLPPFFVG